MPDNSAKEAAAPTYSVKFPLHIIEIPFYGPKSPSPKMGTSWKFGHLQAEERGLDHELSPKGRLWTPLSIPRQPCHYPTFSLHPTLLQLHRRFFPFSLLYPISAPPYLPPRSHHPPPISERSFNTPWESREKEKSPPLRLQSGWHFHIVTEVQFSFPFSPALSLVFCTPGMTRPYANFSWHRGRGMARISRCTIFLNDFFLFFQGSDSVTHGAAAVCFV